VTRLLEVSGSSRMVRREPWLGSGARLREEETKTARGKAWGSLEV
jgi:hypothetical protein